MEKYVNFRIAKGSSAGISNQLNHDLRVGYIAKYIDKEKVADNIVLIDTLKGLTVKEKIKAAKDLIKDKTGRKAQESAEFMFKGIMTFSPEMKKDYEDNPEQFKKSAHEFLNEIAKRYDMIALSAVIHLDETTPHIHLVFDNINQITGKGVRRRISPSKLSKMQTLMGAAFEDMGYKRGVSKVETNAKHIGFKEFKEIEEAIKDLELSKSLLEKVVQEYKKNNPEIFKYVNYFKKSDGKSLKDKNKENLLNAIKDI